MKHLARFALLLLPCSLVVAQQHDTLRLGVLACRPKVQVAEHWPPLDENQIIDAMEQLLGVHYRYTQLFTETTLVAMTSFSCAARVIHRKQDATHRAHPGNGAQRIEKVADRHVAA